MIENRGQNLAAGGNAMSEAAESYDKRQQPYEHDGTGDRVAATHQPCDQGDDPAADNTTPEDVARGHTGSIDPHACHCRYKFGAKRSGPHGKKREEERTQNIAGKNDGP